MARKLKKLPTWAIKKAGGINKKAWALARRGRGARPKASSRKGGRKTPRRVGGGSTAHGSHSPGIVGKLNGFLRGLRLGLPALGVAMTKGITADLPKNAIFVYSGYNIGDMSFNTESAKSAVGFYAGNVVESKVMSTMRIPQMAGQKKLLAVAANFLPEIAAAPAAIAGNFGEAVNALGRTSIGYQATDHQSWLVNPTVRNEWLKALGARVGLGLFSKFAGPMINRHLPKGWNI